MVENNLRCGDSNWRVVGNFVKKREILMKLVLRFLVVGIL